MDNARAMGLVALALAIAGMAIALFAPLGLSDECTSVLAEDDSTGMVTTESLCEQDRSSIFEVGGSRLVIVDAIAVVGPAAVVAISAPSARATARISLWLCTIWLLAVGLMALPSIGIFILPSAATSIATAVLSLRRRAESMT